VGEERLIKNCNGNGYLGGGIYGREMLKHFFEKKLVVDIKWNKLNQDAVIYQDFMMTV
jgi:hypothetical protein